MMTRARASTTGAAQTTLEQTMFVTFIGHHDQFGTAHNVLVALRVGEVIPPDFHPTAIVGLGPTFIESILSTGDLDSPILDLVVAS